jgi:hypothetical protein
VVAFNGVTTTIEKQLVTSNQSSVGYDNVTSNCVSRQAFCVEMTSSNGSWPCSPCTGSTTSSVCEQVAGKSDMSVTVAWMMVKGGSVTRFQVVNIR